MEQETQNVSYALEEVIDRAAQQRKEKVVNRLKHKTDSVQKQKRQQKKRDFAASDRQLLQWQESSYKKKKSAAGSSSDAV